ncbi:hypothetical protein J437_LFUL013510, partial [Ladona fulva]
DPAVHGCSRAIYLFVQTYCVDSQVADSACSATAYLGGVKGNEGTIGVTAAVLRGNCTAAQDKKNHVFSIMKWAQSDIGIKDAAYWEGVAKNILEEHVHREYIRGVANNVIMFLGDGMSVPTLAAARIYEGQLLGKTGEEHSLYFEKFPFSGFSKDAGKSTGVVTTTRITHASPTGTYGHTAERDWESDSDIAWANQDPKVCDDIAEQLVRGEIGKKLNVSRI